MWDYPRPALAQSVDSRVVIELGGRTIVDSQRVVRTIETSHPPSYYVALGDVADGVLVPAGGSSFCE